MQENEQLATTMCKTSLGIPLLKVSMDQYWIRRLYQSEQWAIRIGDGPWSVKTLVAHCRMISQLDLSLCTLSHYARFDGKLKYTFNIEQCLTLDNRLQRSHRWLMP